MNETNDVHPRVAHWLTRSGCLYLYEFCRMDFLTINPRTGELRIIECKYKFGPAVDVIKQLNRYYDKLGIASARRLCIAFGTLSQVGKEEFALNDVTPIMFPESMPVTRIVRYKEGMTAFNEVFKKFYGGKSIRQYQLESSQRTDKFITPTLSLTTAQIKKFRDEEEAAWLEKKRRTMQSA